jgi:hypothetical protein
MCEAFFVDGRLMIQRAKTIRGANLELRVAYDPASPHTPVETTRRLSPLPNINSRNARNLLVIRGAIPERGHDELTSWERRAQRVHL